MTNPSKLAILWTISLRISRLKQPTSHELMVAYSLPVNLTGKKVIHKILQIPILKAKHFWVF